MELPEQILQKVSSSDSQQDLKVEEFDPEFFANNPGVVRAQRFVRQNQNDDIDSIQGVYNINLANNNENREKKFGFLNANKRGKINLEEFNQDQEDIDENLLFNHVSPEIAEKRRAIRDKKFCQISDRSKQQKDQVEKMIKDINSNILSLEVDKERNISKINENLKLVDEDISVSASNNEEHKVDGNYRQSSYSINQPRNSALDDLNKLYEVPRTITLNQQPDQVLKEKQNDIKQFYSQEINVPECHQIEQAPSMSCGALSSIDFNKMQQQDYRLQIVSKIEIIINNPVSQNENLQGIQEIFQMLNQLKISYDPQKIRRLLPIDKDRLKDLYNFYQKSIQVNDKQYEDQESEEEQQSENRPNFYLPVNCVQGDQNLSDSSQRDSSNRGGHGSISMKDLSQNSEQVSIDSKLRQELAQKFKNPFNNDMSPKSSSLNSQMSASSSAGNSNFSKKSSLSSKRKNKLQSLQLEYKDYIKMFQGIFVARCQMMNIEYTKIKQNHDIEKMMVECRLFHETQEDLKKYDFNEDSKTIVIDVENTLVTPYDLKNAEELEQLMKQEKFEREFILIDTKSFSKRQSKRCCNYMNSPMCICKLLLYQVRPYTYEFLNAFQPFFELIAYSNLHKKIIEFIIVHIEKILNKPVVEYIEKNNENPQNQFQRARRMPQIKVYFHFIIHSRQYLYLQDCDIYVENLMILLKNRLKNNLIFVSSHPFRIISSINQGFCTVPMIQYESFYRDDFQLNLVENYILKIRHHNNMYQRVVDDFKFLVQRIDRTMMRKNKTPKIKSVHYFEGNSFERKHAPKEVFQQQVDQPQDELEEEKQQAQEYYVVDMKDSQDQDLPQQLKVQNRLKQKYKTIQMKEEIIKPMFKGNRIVYDADSVILEESQSHSQSAQSQSLRRDFSQNQPIYQSVEESSNEEQ